MERIAETVKKMSTATRLTLVIAGVIVAGAAIASYLVYTISLRDLAALERRNLLSTLGQETHELSRLFSDSEETAGILAAQESVAKFIAHGVPARTSAQMVRVFDSFNINNQYSAIFLLNATGTAVASTDPAFMGQNYSFRSYFKEAMEGRRSMLMAIGVTSLQPGYYFSAPIMGAKNNPIGVVVMKRDADVINKMIEGYVSGTYSPKIMLVNEDGIVVSSNVLARVFKSLGVLSPEALARIKNARTFPGIEVGPLQYDVVLDALLHYEKPTTVDVIDKEDGATEVLGISRVGDYPFYFVYEANMGGVEATAINAAIMLAMLIMLISLAVLAGVALIMRSTFGVITRVVDSVVRISEGNFKERLEIDGGFEVQTLSNAFNSMVERLDNLYTSMEEKIRSATADLAMRVRQSEQQRIMIADAKREIEVENAKHEAILESIDNAVVVVDRQNRLVFANRGAAKMLGLEIDDVLGNDASALASGAQYDDGSFVPISQSILARSLTEGKILRERFLLVLNSGKKVPVSAVVSPYSQDSVILGVVAVVRDVTEEKKLEDARSGFISVAAHQMRAPLTAIRWFGEMLAEGIGGKLNKKQADLAGEINKSTERMSDLVNFLLQTARVETGRVKVAPVPIVPEVLAKEVAKSLEVLRKKGMQKIKIESSLPNDMMVNMDRDFLWQVLQNLIGNALQYSPKRATVTVSFTENDGDIECAVKDEGIGIPQAAQANIFTKFYRAPNAVRLVPDGSGIGLSLAKTLIEGWGGKIWFESEEGKGATFFFTIPKRGVEPKEGDVRLMA